MSRMKLLALIFFTFLGQCKHNASGGLSDFKLRPEPSDEEAKQALNSAEELQVDSSGCFWSAQENAKRESDSKFKILSTSLCELEQETFNAINALRQANNPDLAPLVYMHQLSVLERTAARATSGSAMWLSGATHKSYLEIFPKAAQIIALTKENHAEMMRYGRGQDLNKLANEIAMLWFSETDDRGPILDARNSYCGVGAYYQEAGGHFYVLAGFGALK